ncbi:MAG: 50S ribosomal protein L1 [Candidatus Marinimicrobia bacterium]|nr:50S ribosomal protein L1 [Candidatus Neomarinimicrobiota bacterium]MDD5581874.1 50S ribosomal protein L1 [Candidatus Neomarinimicrobiota bacterium]
MKHSRRYRELLKQVDREYEYPLNEGIKLLKKIASAHFDETVELSINLGVDPKYADQMVRGTVILPYGTGKKIRVLVFAQGEKVKEALDAGTDYAGLDEYIQKIQNGWLDFDVVIATPDVMRHIGKLGRVLGPHGLMPNPKTGTVTENIAQAVADSKAGKINFRVDRYGIVHVGVGKISFEENQLVENIKTMVTTLIKLRPPSAKGQYLQKITLTSTMGPGIKIEKQTALA